MVPRQDNEEGSPTEEEDVMKKIGSFTARGSIRGGTTERITLFDGRFDTGYVITKFVVVVSDPDNSSMDCYGMIGTTNDMGTTWKLEQQTQLGWASMYNSGNATGPTAQPFSLVDRDNLVIEDLYIYGETHSDGLLLNYYIEMDRYEFNDWKGALTMVRNRSQA